MRSGRQAEIPGPRCHHPSKRWFHPIIASHLQLGVHCGEAFGNLKKKKKTLILHNNYNVNICLSIMNFFFFLIKCVSLNDLNGVEIIDKFQNELKTWLARQQLKYALNKMFIWNADEKFERLRVPGNLKFHHRLRFVILPRIFRYDSLLRLNSAPSIIRWN